jgi:hypothetical protein
MTDIKEIQYQERRNQLASRFEALQQAKELHRESNIKDRFNYLEKKLDGIFLILEQLTRHTKSTPMDTDALDQYPLGSYLEELTRQALQ